MENLEKALHIHHAIEELYESGETVTEIERFTAVYEALLYIEDEETLIELADYDEEEEIELNPEHDVDPKLDSSAVESEFNEFSPSVMEEAIYQRPEAVLEWAYTYNTLFPTGRRAPVDERAYGDKVSWYDGRK